LIQQYLGGEREITSCTIIVPSPQLMCSQIGKEGKEREIANGTASQDASDE